VRTGYCRVAVIAWLVLLFCLAGVARAGDYDYSLNDQFGHTGRGRAEIEEPSALAIYDDRLIATTDAERNTVVLFDERRRWVRSLGSPKGDGAVVLDNPSGVLFDLNGRIWVADTGNNRLVVLSQLGNQMATMGGFGVGKGSFRGPTQMAIDRTGRVYVIDSGNRRIQIFAQDGRFVDEWHDPPNTGSKRIVAPVDVAFSREDDGFIWVANKGDATLQKLDLDGVKDSELDLSALVEGEIEIADIFVEDGFSRIFILDTASRRVVIIDRRGRLLAEVALAEVAAPKAISLDWNLNLYVADGKKDRLYVYDRR